MATTTITTTGTTNWVCPAGVTTVQVELWAAGGTGGPATGNPARSGGGAGAQYAVKQVAVTPGNTYAVVVPAASTASASAAVNGADATFAATTVVAKGGIGGANATGTSGAGGAGSTTGGVGDTVFAGGDGSAGTAGGVSGAGGGGAGSTGTGNSASAGTAGAAKANNGGTGGAGVTVASTRNVGTNYGAGGSGSIATAATNQAGANGTQGLAVLTYTLPKAETLVDTFATTDTAKWAFTGASATGGQLVITSSASLGNAVTVNPWALTDSSFLVEGVTMSGSGTVTYIQIYSTADNSDALWMLHLAPTLYFRASVNGADNDLTTTFNATAHRWWRIRVSADGTTAYWDTSPDGLAWTNQRTKTGVTEDFSSVTISLSKSANATGGNAVFDNVNNAPTVAVTSLVPPVRRPNYGSLLHF